MEFKVTEVYRENMAYFKKKEIRHIINRGSTSSGKSISILQLLLVVALEEKCHIVIVGETTPKVKRTVWKDFFNVVIPNNLAKHFKVNKTELIIKTPNGSVISFLSADSESKIRGMRQDYAFFDEINSIPQEVVEQISIRTKKKILSAFNPVSVFWLTEEIKDRDDFVEIVSTYKQNPFLDSSIIQEIQARGRKDENFHRIFELGEYGITTGVIFDNWEIMDDTELPLRYDVELWGQDYGFTNDPTTLIQIRFVGDSVFIKEHLYQTGLLNRDVALKIKQHNTHNRKVIADNAEPKTIEELKRVYGINIKGVDKPPILQSIDILKQKDIFVTSDSLNLIKELRYYTWHDKKVDKKGRPVPIENWNHCLDALRYCSSTHYRPNSMEQTIIF